MVPRTTLHDLTRTDPEPHDVPIVVAMTATTDDTVQQDVGTVSNLNNIPQQLGHNSRTIGTNNHVTIPLVQVSIENLSYAPMVTMTQPTPIEVTTIENVDSHTQKKKKKMKKPFDSQFNFLISTTKTIQQRKVILNHITTTIEPYQLTAWMGPSGSGKTSLMSVVAGLVTPSDIVPTSVMKVNQEIGTIPKRYIGVVWQDDLLLSNLTVEENLYIAARLKTSNDVSDDAVRTIVVETMKELNLLHVRHTLVGDPLLGGNSTTRGISGGERKRVAVGMELVVRPSILLLDEITSGLDSTTAYHLMITLQQLAHTKGHTIVVVIHQHRTTIFNLFDHLVLLSRGNIIYDGPPNQLRSYLELCYDPLPPETGIANWMMDIVTTVEKKYGPNTQSTPDDDDDDNNNNNKNMNELAEQWRNYCSEMRHGTNGELPIANDNKNINKNETTKSTGKTITVSHE